METPPADGVTVHSFQIGDNELLLAELVRNETGAEYEIRTMASSTVSSGARSDLGVAIFIGTARSGSGVENSKLRSVFSHWGRVPSQF